LNSLSNQVVIGLFRSEEGGAPKPSVDSLQVQSEGCVGDFQRDKKHHGGPKRAVCIFSQDIITKLQDDGNPISAGDCGENMVFSNLDWDEISEGIVLQVGSVKLKIESDAPPCKTISHAFKDGKFKQISQKSSPGNSRWYCSVLQEGIVSVGDTVEII